MPIERKLIIAGRSIANSLGSTRWLRIRKSKDQVHSFFRGISLHQGDGLPHESEQVGRLELILFPSLLDPREIQNVFNERRKAAAFLPDEPEVLRLLLRFQYFSPLKTLSHQP